MKNNYPAVIRTASTADTVMNRMNREWDAAVISNAELVSVIREMKTILNVGVK